MNFDANKPISNQIPGGNTGGYSNPFAGPLGHYSANQLAHTGAQVAGAYMGGVGYGALGALAGANIGGKDFPAQGGGDFFGNASNNMSNAVSGPHSPNLLNYQSPALPMMVDSGFNAVPHSNGSQIAGSDQFRGTQMALANHLLDQATGNGPSIAATQTQNAMGQAMAQNFAMANSNQGSGHAAALRQAQGQQATMGGNMAVQSGLARLAEQQQAAGTLGQVAQGARGQDLENAINQAQLNQGNNQFNANMSQNVNQMNMQGAIANQNAGLQYQNQLLNETGMQNQNLLQKYQIQNQGFGAALGAGGGALAALAAMM